MGLQENSLLKSGKKAFLKLGLTAESEHFTAYVYQSGRLEGYQGKLRPIGLISVTKSGLTFLQIKKGLFKNGYEEGVFTVPLESIRHIDVAKSRLGYAALTLTYTDGQTCVLNLQPGVYGSSVRDMIDIMKEYLPDKVEKAGF